MSSESETRSNEMQSLLERLITSRNRDLSMFLPFLFGYDPDSTREENPSNPDQNSRNNSDPQQHDESQRDRIVLINPISQEMVVIEGTGFDSLIRSAQRKDGQPPASKSAIDAMPSVEITEEEDEHECVICLENCGVGESVKKMPCEHKFHGGCIEKWLKLHGSCPVCRFKMPVEEEEVAKKSNDDDDDESDRRSNQRGIWVSLSFGRRRNNNTENERENGNESNSGDLGNQRNEMQ